MAYYDRYTGTYRRAPKPDKMESSNPNMAFKHKKWLEDLRSDGTAAAKKRVAEQAITKEYVDEHVGAGIDITEVGNKNPCSEYYHTDGTEAELTDITEVGGSSSTITKIDQHGNEYVEQRDPVSGMRYLKYTGETVGL